VPRVQVLSPLPSKSLENTPKQEEKIDVPQLSTINNLPNSSYRKQEKNIEVVTFTSLLYDLSTIDNLVKYSDIIILGTVTETENISKSDTKYLVSVDRTIKGTCTDDIDVYETKDTLQEGKQYLLFLECYYTPLYPREIYTSIDKESIFELSGNKIIGATENANELFKDAQELDKAIDLIKSCEGIKHENNANAVRNKGLQDTDSDNLNNLIEGSDYIVHVLVNEVKIHNKYVSSVKTSVLKQYKGDLGDTNGFLLPSSIEVGKEYLLFLTKYEDGGLDLSSRKGSVICKDDIESWNRVIGLVTRQ